jgi:hypothetical protein
MLSMQWRRTDYVEGMMMMEKWEGGAVGLFSCSILRRSRYRKAHELLNHLFCVLQLYCRGNIFQTAQVNAAVVGNNSGLQHNTVMLVMWE